MTDQPRIPAPEAIIAASAGTPRTLHLAHGTPPPTNPDTGNPLPSPSPSDVELVEELINRYHDRMDGGNHDRVLEEVLTEAVTRSRGRTYRLMREAARIAASTGEQMAVAGLALALQHAQEGQFVAARAETDLAALQLAAAESLSRHHGL